MNREEYMHTVATAAIRVVKLEAEYRRLLTCQNRLDGTEMGTLNNIWPKVVAARRVLKESVLCVSLPSPPVSQLFGNVSKHKYTTPASERT